jgi:hypothetical protein
MAVKVISVFTLVTFLFMDIAWAQSIPTPPAVTEKSQHSLNLREITIPEELGFVQEHYKAEDTNPTVILIQDAHAIPEAQRNIQKLIGHFQKEYGIRFIGVEGAASELDPQIFRSFPNKEALQKVLDEYYEKGELTGPTAAAILNESDSVYQGVEDWNLYEDGLARYLRAVEIEPNEASTVARAKAKSLFQRSF